MWINGSVYRFRGSKVCGHMSQRSARLDVNVKKCAKSAYGVCERKGKMGVLCTLLGLLIDPGWLGVSKFGRPWDAATDVDRLSGSTAVIVRRHR